MAQDRLFVLQVVIAIEEQWFANYFTGTTAPPTRTERTHRIDESLFATSHEEEAYSIASGWVANECFSDANHDGVGDLTRIFAIGIHQLTEVTPLSEIAEKTRELYGVYLPGFYLGDIDSSGVPVVRRKEELKALRRRV